MLTDKKWNVRYAANAGLVLRLGEWETGIDLFCRDPESLYIDTSEILRQALLEEIAEKKQRLLIFTHEHGDHFYGPDALRACRLNPELKIITTPQVRNLLLQQDAPANRIFAVPTEPEGRIFWEETPAGRLGFFYAVHEGAQYAEVRNLCILFEGGGRHLVMPGDAAASPELFGKIAGWSEHIDWFFAPFPYVGLSSARKLLKEFLDIDNIFVLHQPRPRADALGWVEKTKSMCRRSHDGLPFPVFPEKAGDWYELS